LVIVGALGAGYIGLSASTTLGYKKLLLAAVGVVAAIVGGYFALSK
jgi:hypothetical protein